MARSHPTRWLSDEARVGLRELRANAARLVSRAVRPGEVAGSAATRTREKARELKATMVDASPLGDSVETRMERARAAAQSAQEAEDDALEAARWSEESSARAKELAESNRAWLTDLKREIDDRVKQRVAEARRAADEQVEQERAAAQREADQELEAAQAQSNGELEAAERDAEEKQQRAEDLEAEARERFAEAQQLADEAVQAARAIAEDAHRQAQQLVEDAEQQANSADELVAAAAQVRVETTDGDLESQSKAELLDLAASMEIEGRTTMSKAELISAITKAADTAR
jgi:colicin import membrane protein